MPKNSEIISCERQKTNHLTKELHVTSFQTGNVRLANEKKKGMYCICTVLDDWRPAVTSFT